MASCLSAFDPAPTSTLMKIPGSSATASPAKPVAAGGRKARPSIKALQEEKPPPFTPVPGVPLASSNTATTTAATRTAVRPVTVSVSVRGTFPRERVQMPAHCCPCRTRGAHSLSISYLCMLVCLHIAGRRSGIRGGCGEGARHNPTQCAAVAERVTFSNGAAVFNSDCTVAGGSRYTYHCSFRLQRTG